MLKGANFADTPVNSLILRRPPLDCAARPPGPNAERAPLGRPFRRCLRDQPARWAGTRRSYL
jgi:hypothetical protein